MSLSTIPWVVTDVSRTPVADALVGWIHLFRVPLFFALAGYFARAALARKGPRGFATDRTASESCCPCWCSGRWRCCR